METFANIIGVLILIFIFLILLSLASIGVGELERRYGEEDNEESNTESKENNL